MSTTNHSVILWRRSADGLQGHGKPISRDQAVSCAAEMNAKYPEIQHRVIDLDGFDERWRKIVSASTRRDQE